MMKEIFNLENKRILITGASKGLGSLCAKNLAEQGAKLVLMARSKAKLEDVKNSCLLPEKHLAIPVDLTEMEQLHESVKKAVEFSGGFDVLLHVAGGGLGLSDPLLDFESLQKLYKLNLFAGIEINRLIIPDMIKNKQGNVVHVCSISSSEATGSVGYNSVKSALAAYVRTFGREMAGHGIVVTGIMPGEFYAPGNPWEKKKANRPKMVKQFIKERLPRGFLANAEELMPMILLLCSDAASMMGGCLVPIDAGQGIAYLSDC